MHWQHVNRCKSSSMSLFKKKTKHPFLKDYQISELDCRTNRVTRLYLIEFEWFLLSLCASFLEASRDMSRGGGEALPYMGYTGMCRCEGYGFQEVYSRIGYINQSVWV